MVDNRVFYRKNAQAFFDRTAHENVEKLYAPFLPLLPAGAHILDAGCGSGRDTKVFSERGYVVTAFDATPEMAELAEQFSGQKIRILRFQEMDYVEEFDGIWACASLLHVALAELPTVFERFITALKPSGYWSMSFKYGEGEKQRGERQFTDFTENSLRTFSEGFEQLRVVNIFASGDTRQLRNEQERWVSAIVQKVPSAQVI
jgi:SAM-dependent methyltransferase